MRKIRLWTAGCALAVLAVAGGAAQDRAATSPSSDNGPDPATFRDPPVEVRPQGLFASKVRR